MEPTPDRIFKELPCLYYRSGPCLKCIKDYPTGALTIEDLERKICYGKCLEADKLYDDLETCDSCGKYAVGFCAYYE